MMPRRLLILAFLSFSLWSCSRVIISKNAGANFPPTNPHSILVHEGVAPAYPFVIIGRISLDTTWTIKPGKDENKIKRMAAEAGADGIIVTGLDINIDAFNKFVAGEGYAKVSGSDLSAFAEDVYPRALYLEQSKTYGYMIRRTG